MTPTLACALCGKQQKEVRALVMSDTTGAAICDECCATAIPEFQRAGCLLLMGTSFNLTPIPMFLTCPNCGERHIDEGEFATKPHRVHACQKCGLTWQPAQLTTVGVQFLPGHKNESKGT